MRSLTTCLLMLLLTTLASAQETADTTLIINEVQVANLDQFLDNANCYGSWIELYNPNDTAVSLKYMHLNDGVNDYRMLTFFGSVPAKGFKTIWFDHPSTEGNYGSTSRQQIPFKLEYEGGTISLLSADLTVLSSVDYPPATPRCSWARTQDGGDTWRATGDPTPGATNTTSKFANFRQSAPSVDTDSRVFSESFTVNVTIPRATTLRYTTDGSAPTATNGETSTNGRFEISSTTILRLCLLRSGYLPSPVVTRSYIYQNHDYYLPILSVVSDPKHFYDNKVGIFVKGTNGVSGNGQNSACNWNMDWERPINMELLVQTPSDSPVEGESTGQEVSSLRGDLEGSWSMVLNQEADIEICGGWTRAYGKAFVDDRYWEARPSFRIKADKRYEGANVISYPVFPMKPYNKYRCWQVRNGGNDTYSRSKDASIQQIVLRSGFYVDCQDYQPAHVFLNGEYYGMLNIRESNNKHFAYSNYGIDFDDMDQFDLSNGQYNQKVGDNKAWSQLQTLAKRLGNSKKEEFYNEICTLLDIDEFINYMALECYMGPSDWITNNNNVKGFRSRSDGKFHFVLFDTDSAFGTSSMLTQLLNSDVSTNVDDLFRNMMKYDPFRRQFMDAFCLVDGSVFEPIRCEEIIWDIYENTNPALSFEGSSTGMGLASTIYNAYNGSRINNLRNYFRVKFGLYADIYANIPEARLCVNGQQIPTGQFAGYLFSYNNMPIELSAKAPAGYTFSGWETESGELIAADETIDLHEMFSNDDRVELQAVFTPIKDAWQRLEAGATPLRINEVCATGDIHINDYGKKADWVELYNTTDEDISLAGLYLSDDPNDPEKYQLTSSSAGTGEAVVRAHSTYIIWCDGKNAISQAHAPFKLKNTDGACVSIQAADGSWTDRLEYKQQSKWQTYGRYPDGGNLTSLLNQPTIDQSNRIGMMDYAAIKADEDAIRVPKPDLASAKLRAVEYYNLNGQIVNGQMVNGQWSMVNGQWSMVNGKWSMVNGKWSNRIIIRKEIYEDGSTRVTKLQMKSK